MEDEKRKGVNPEAINVPKESIRPSGSREIVSLHGLIKPKRHEAPPSMLFAYCGVSCEDDCGVPCMHLEIEMFVRMSLLSKDLQDQVRKEISKISFDEGGLHPDTKAELDAVRKANRERSK